MTLSLFTSAGAVRAASLLIGFAVLGCEQTKSPPADTSAAAAAKNAPSPEATPEDMRAFAAAHLPPGWKPGDFLTKKRDYPTGDTADVYRAVLDTLYTTKDGSPGEVILNDFAMTGIVTCVQMPCPIKPIGMQKEPKLETLDAYRIAKLTRRHITPKLKFRLPLKLIDEDEQRELEIDGRTIVSREGTEGKSNQEHPFWIGFAARHPKAWGFAVLSVVGMNPQKNEAILQVSHRCGGGCHHVETMLLWKVRGRWHVVERAPEEGEQWTPGPTTLRYVGLGAKKPEWQIQAEARAKQVADSLKADSLPRDIHGRLTSTNGDPIADATITLHDGDNPNRPDVFANTDADGKYRFVKPAIGQPGVMVRCPHTSQRPDSLMLVTATTVTAGTATELNMSADRRMCDDAAPVREVKTIQPAFDAPPLPNGFDVARARTSTYPGEEEAAVYRALLDHVALTSPGNTTLLYATTRTFCALTDCAKPYTDLIRYEPAVFLSTLQNFLAVRNTRFTFKPDFPGRGGITQIGDSALAQLERITSRGRALDNIELLHRAWPDVERIISLSPIGFSPFHKQAMVEVIRTDINGTRSGEMWILNRTKDGWRAVRSFPSAPGNND